MVEEKRLNINEKKKNVIEQKDDDHVKSERGGRWRNHHQAGLVVVGAAHEMETCQQVLW